MTKFENNARLVKTVLIANFNIGEVRGLIHDLGEDHEIIASGASTLDRLAQDTTRWFQARVRLHEVWNRIAVLRPFLDWETTDGSVPPVAQEPSLPEPTVEADREWELLTQQGRLMTELFVINNELVNIYLAKQLKAEG